MSDGVCTTIEQALKAAQQAEQEGLKGLYPSACQVMANYISALYRRVDIIEGQPTEPAQFVGVYVTKWEKRHEPTVAFVQVDLEELKGIKS